MVIIYAAPYIGCCGNLINAYIPAYFVTVVSYDCKLDILFPSDTSQFEKNVAQSRNFNSYYFKKFYQVLMKCQCRALFWFTLNYHPRGLLYKTFYDCNYVNIVIGQSVCKVLSHTAQSNLWLQGQRTLKWSPRQVG